MGKTTPQKKQLRAKDKATPVKRDHVVKVSVDSPRIACRRPSISFGKLAESARAYEYSSAANPNLSQVPHLALGPKEHKEGPSRVIEFDLSKELGVEYKATSPNLMCAFVRILAGESVETKEIATSHCFYVLRGAGQSDSSHGPITWSKGDLFVLPHTEGLVKHTATKESALYCVTDAPLLKYLGVVPNVQKFEPTMFTNERLQAEVEEVSHAPGAAHKNRCGVLLGNKVTEDSTKTLTHTLWSLLNKLPAKQAQPPHRHNSVALDLCVSSAPKGVYTLMGPELGEDGWVKNPIRMNWASGGMFVTPPGWWHSHHNESGEEAWVLPIQDAGLLTHQRVLDIRFSHAKMLNYK